MATVVQKLSSLQRPALLRHLRTLSQEDRRLRFGNLELRSGSEGGTTATVTFPASRTIRDGYAAGAT